MYNNSSGRAGCVGACVVVLEGWRKEKGHKETREKQKEKEGEDGGREQSGCRQHRAPR